jgi:hypothetical protein
VESKIEGEDEIPEAADSLAISDMPRFDHRPESFAETLSNSAAYLCHLLLSSAVLIGACFITFSRSDVRDEF